MGNKKKRIKKKKPAKVLLSNTPSGGKQEPASTAQPASPRRRFPWGKVIVTVGLVTGLVSFWNDWLGLREHYSPVRKETIVLSSERIDLGSGAKKAVNNFVIQNIGPADLFQVAVKLQINSSALTNDGDIGVEVIESPANYSLPVLIPGDSTRQVLVADMLQLIPGRDFTEHNALWVMINRLAAGGRAGLRIKNASSKTLPAGEHYLAASVAFFTNMLPATFMFDDGSPGTVGPRTEVMGMKSIGPGKIQILSSLQVTNR